MAKKKWIICGECEYLSQCSAGQARIKGVNVDSDIYNDIGCFNHEQYHFLNDGKQLKLL